MDLDLHTTFISPSVTRLRGYTLAELQALPLERQLTPTSWQTVQQALAAHLTPEKLAQPDAATQAEGQLARSRKVGMDQTGSIRGGRHVA